MFLMATAVTGFDAFTHSFESYVRELASPYTMLLGKESMKTIIQVLPKLVKDISNMEYREFMSRAAAFSGISLSNASATIPHPLSEVIGGVTLRIAHGQCLACLYPAFIKFQITKTPEKCADVARLFDPSLEQVSDEEAASHLPGQIEAFLKEIGLYNTLSNLGVTKEQFEYLDITEKKWLNQYHEKVYNGLGKFLPENERKWLKKITEPIS